MVPIAHVRRNILRVTQAELASACGKAQATISRWEKGELEPDAADIRKILAYASERGVALAAADLFPPAGAAA